MKKVTNKQKAHQSKRAQAGTKVTRIADCVLLSERRFIQWYVVWEGYDRESATAKYEVQAPTG